MSQLTPEDASVLMNFLNRVEFKGHVERNSMNILAAKLHMIANPPPPTNVPDGAGDYEVPTKPEDTTDGEQPQEIPGKAGKKGQVTDD